MSVFQNMNDYKDQRKRTAVRLEEWILGIGLLGSILLVAGLSGYIDYSTLFNQNSKNNVVGQLIKYTKIPVSDVFNADQSHASEGTAEADNSSLVRVTPKDDSYVSSSNPTKSYVSSTSLKVGSEPRETSYLKFVVPDKEFSKVVLRLYAEDKSNSGGDVSVVTDNLWSAELLTFDSQPGAGKQKITKIGPTSPNTSVDILVTDYVKQGKVVTFEVENLTENMSYYSSRQSSEFSPVLLFQ